MNRQPSDVALFVYVVAVLVGLMLAALALGGCSLVVPTSGGPGRAALRSTQPAEWSADEGGDAPVYAASRGPITFHVHIVNAEDARPPQVLSFVFLCARVVKLLRGEGVQS